MTTRVLVDLLFYSGTRGGTETYVKEVYRRLDASGIEFVGFASKELAAMDTSWFPGEIIDSGISGFNRLAFRHPEWVPTRATGWFLRWMIGGAAKNARRIVTDSEAARSDIRELLRIPDERISVILLASSTAVAAANVPRLPNLIFSPGNRMPHKGMQTLAEAIALIPASRRPRLAVTASSPTDPLRDQAEKLGISDSVEFNAWLTREQLERLYHEATIVALPTMFEGFGLPVLEAMAYGAPVVCSDLPVLHEVGGDAAIYVKPGSPQQFAAEIERVMGDEALRADLAKAGLARAAMFSWDTTAAEFAAVLMATARS
jgi:glycosyltransferase involved in cell wall biosynthesis